ncbi:MAG: FtsX-like permease family protein [Candidatus Aminicenantes bacterium]|nr:FtsX-like permease family protein [Candidatus Aminicenantes bacterium]
MLFKLAFRNVFRYRRRTIITFSAISYGLGLMAVGISLYNGVDTHAMDNIINSQTAHLKILAAGYFEKKDEVPLEFTIDEPQEIKSLLKNNRDIQGIESRVLFQASIISGMDELPCMGVAIEPEIDPLVFKIKDSIIDGRFLEPSESKIILGSGLARDLGLKVGDDCTLRIFFSIEDFIWNALDLEIAGIAKTENPMVNRGTVFIPLSLAQEALSLENSVTELAVRIEDRRRLLEVRESIEGRLASLSKDYEVVSFEEYASDFKELMRMRSRMQALIPLMMILIATLGIVNTMLMAVMERTREIGMLAAMGMRKMEVMLVFIFEGALIGIFGSFAACVIGGLGGWWLEAKGFSLAFLGEEIAEMVSFLPMEVYKGDLTAGTLIFTFILGTVISILASLYPAYKAVKLDPIQALRHVG